MLYRFNQLYNAVFAKVNRQEYIWLEAVLKPDEFALFKRQTLTEQRHALDVANDIRNNCQDISAAYGKKAYNDLIVASLLHDCGKSLIELHLWQRIVIVTAGYLPVRIKNFIAARINLVDKTLVVYEQHPAWGKRLAAKAGLNENVLNLIQNHHTPQNSLERILYMADNRH